MNRILLVFPDALFVNIIRDGSDVALSYTKGGIIPNLETAARQWITSVRRHKDLPSATHQSVMKSVMRTWFPIRYQLSRPYAIFWI